MNRLDEGLAKIARPRNRQIYRRTGLFRKLDDATETPGIWICGPPGSGKTTLISSYLQEQNRTCLWYQIDNSDLDIATLFWYLRLAAKNISPRSYSQLEPFSSAYQGSLKAFASRYFEKLYGLLPPGFLIVLDDYHLSDGDSVLDSVIVQAITMLPHHGNIVVVSREQPSSRFSRLLGNELLQLIGWDELRLAPDEIRGISALRRPGHSEQSLASIEARSDGWAAGLILQLQNIHVDSNGHVPVQENDHEALFGYFANEVFERQDADAQSIVMQLALLPIMTQEMAYKLTDNERAISLLKWLHQRNNFVELQSLQVPTYRFHPLFRDFLLDRLRQNIAANQLRKLEKKAAFVLEVAKYKTSACELYKSAGEWGKVTELICADAPGKFRQGRIKGLEKSIRGLPADIVAENPWLSYWLGITRIFLDPKSAHQYFSRAFQQFQDKSDAVGSLSAWSGAVNSLLTEWGDMKSLDQWISSGEKLLPADAQLPDDIPGAHAVTSMCSALFICRPHSPRLEEFVQKTHILITTSDDRTFSLMGCNLLLIFYAWQGDITKMRLLVDAIRPGTGHQDISDAHRVMWAAAEGWFELVSGRPEKCLEISVNALELAEKCGVHLFDYKFHGMATQANLILGRATAARVHIDGYFDVIPGKANLLRFHAHFLSAWQAWLAGELTASREQLSMAAYFLKAAGSVPIIGAKTDIAAAILHFEGSEYAEAKIRLSNAKRVAKATGSIWLQYHCLLLDAVFARQSGHHDQCLRYLRNGFQLGREHGLTMTDWWDAPTMSQLCELALANDIERQHVCGIIKKTGLQPCSKAFLSTDWPWPVRVEVLGHFRLIVQGDVISGRTKSQKKVLELLKVLIALGGKRVSAARLADAVWSDAEGDDARNALKTTIHRLRKLLGVPEAIELKDGCLSLCTRYCWVDALVFSSLAMTPRSSADRIANRRQALKLYQGPLLAEEENLPWMIAPRAHLQKTAHKIVMELGVRHEGRLRWNEAIRVYRKGLDTDPIDEQICRHLMQCYQQSGRDEAAIDTYEHCCSELKAQVARSPSAKTRLLAESIAHA